MKELISHFSVSVNKIIKKFKKVNLTEEELKEIHDIVSNKKQELDNDIQNICDFLPSTVDLAEKDYKRIDKQIDNILVKFDSFLDIVEF